ncbi:MAG: T9SS type A sorting domain-containing protein [Bacteroidota bacterium]|jgi:hypothetical protein
MKFTLPLLFFLNILNAQQQPLSPPIEMYFGTENVITSTSYTLSISSKSTVFDVQSNDQINHSTSIYNTSSFTPLANNESVDNYWGWNFVNDITIPSSPTFAYGLYKFSLSSTNIFFYIDFRDSRFGFYQNYSPPSIGHDADLWLKFNEFTGKMYYCTKPGYFDWTEISNGQILTIWDIKGKGTPSTNNFENFWINSIAVVPTLNNTGIVVPLVVWGPLPNFLTEGYKIYRYIDGQTIPPNTFNLIAQVSSNQFTYIDNSTTAIGNKIASYKIKAYNSSIESAFSNPASISTSGINPNNRDVSFSSIKKNLIFSLEQNYPNPFNPITTIPYSILKPSHVRLTVYDILGRIIAELVNTPQQPGQYSVQFNASSMPSGLFYYQLETSQYTAIKKMIYVR